LDADQFIMLAERLTGTPVKDITPTDRAILAQLLAEDARSIGHSQLNELLLLVNKDRMERAFFDYFFGDGCTVAALEGGVRKFQTLAMLGFGNFIYAYRTLSRSPSIRALEAALGEWARRPEEILADLAARGPKLVDIELIPRGETPLVGYISAGEVVAEGERCAFLRAHLPGPDVLSGADWPAYEDSLSTAAETGEQLALRATVAGYRKRYPGATLAQFAAYLGDVVPGLQEKAARLDAVREMARRNQDIYLTWDHMDVYFATSMRKRWEFEDLFDFVNGLMIAPQLAGLNLRHFDPTQAFTRDRVDKGLVESLMLKRAKCTVYSVQDTDTLGKDSELAATLAQGKPVIAYVPTVDIETRTHELAQEDPATVQDRLRFVLYADDRFAQSISPDDYEFVRGFRAIEQFEADRIWRTLADPQAVESFRAAHGAHLMRLCGIVAASEARIYDRRARTLMMSHPLGIQVNLTTGVANGVLVVRTIPQCAELLRRVVTNALEFELTETGSMWYLKEKISGCVYRVVTKDRKLTNCFWNFYRREQG
jgi:hypothetical protein